MQTSELDWRHSLRSPSKRLQEFICYIYTLIDKTICGTTFALDRYDGGKWEFKGLPLQKFLRESSLKRHKTSFCTIECTLL